MAEYTKPWASFEAQISTLKRYGLTITSPEQCTQILQEVGYYRFTGFLYPFRESETYFAPEKNREQIRVLDNYRPGTRDVDGFSLIDFDRNLRLLVLEGVERIELALRTQIGYVTGRVSTFAQLDLSLFVESFTEPGPENSKSKHEEWLARIESRQNNSDETFVAHFRNKYDNLMPVWALVEIMELGQLARMYQGLSNSLATEIAIHFGAPNKKTLASWIVSINYVRNISAHHARLFNRKLVDAPSRPKIGQVPLLDHFRSEESSKQIFGVYNTLAVMAYIIKQIDAESDWYVKVAKLFLQFPSSTGLEIASLGAPSQWADLELWKQ